MRWTDIGDTRCAAARALGAVGDRWTLLLLRDAFAGTRRFEGFQANTSASRAIIADRLKTLTASGVFERVAYSEHPPRFEYRLTDKGRDLYPVITALMAWSDRWDPHPDGPLVTLVHRACGAAFHPTSVCPHCGGSADSRQVRAVINAPATEVVARPGPGEKTFGQPAR
jgi:DNA-binding HxlR family transcriptional regulator